MADDTAAGSSPAPDSGATATPASATETPSTGVTQDTQTGEPPRERWNDILTNARTKTRQEVESEYRQRYGWADEFQRDPSANVLNWIDQASQHPLMGDAIRRAILERAQRFQPQPPAHATVEKPKPDIPIVDAQGNPTGRYTYSDEALAQLFAWQEQKFEERFGSLEGTMQEREQREQLQQIQHQSAQQVHSKLTHLRQNPHFAQNEAKVRQALFDHPEWEDNIEAAFNHVLVTDILPNLSTAERRGAVEALTGKGAGNSVNPGGTAPAQPKFKSMKAALKYYDEHPEEAAAMAKRR